MPRALLVLVLTFLLATAPAAAETGIHAHRGGPLVAGAPFSPEDAQPAFEFADENGADVVELDAKLSSDGVPVVIHDATLDRTTDCAGQVAQRSAADLAQCHVDVLGTDSTTKPVTGSTVAIPKLADVLSWARANGVKLNLEIKNQPTDPDYDPGSTFATRIVETVTASGIPRDHVLIQSFWPPNLDVAEAAGYRTSFLSLANSSNGTIEFAQSRGYEVVSPAWPIPNAADYVRRAHAAGKEVVPYTFNKEDEVRAAVEAGVDAVIANDLIFAQRAIYGLDCPAARLREAKLRASLQKARAKRNRARGRARATAQASVVRVNLKRQAAKRLRRKVCTPGT
jgi:glycerophosphoryl diester phosphodiesterase